MATPTKIFLLDDDPAVTNLLKAKLGKVEGFEVRASNDPRQAPLLIAQFQPHIVVCDIDMGETDGGTVAQLLRENLRTAGIPVLFLTSLVSQAHVRRNDGVVGGRLMISKEATVTELTARIREIVG